MDKFLLAENPLRPEQSGLWIVHMLDPIAIIRCTEGHVKADTIYQHFEFNNINGVPEQWTLSVYHLFTTDFLETPDKRALPLLDRAWRWLRAYFEEEDKNISNEKR